MHMNQNSGMKIAKPNVLCHEIVENTREYVKLQFLTIFTVIFTMLEIATFDNWNIFVHDFSSQVEFCDM